MSPLIVVQRAACVVAALAAGLMTSVALAQQPLSVKALAEKKVDELPKGELFWRIETFPSLEQAKAAAGEWSLPVDSGGKAWLFTLGSAGGAGAKGTKVGEVGPITRIVAQHYLLRINDASGSPGSMTSVHSHPGSEAFFVLTGEQTIRGADGVKRVEAGQAEPGQRAGSPMQVSSTGSTDLHALVMFVVDADKPFSSPASLH